MTDFVAVWDQLFKARYGEMEHHVAEFVKAVLNRHTSDSPSEAPAPQVEAPAAPEATTVGTDANGSPVA